MLSLSKLPNLSKFWLKSDLDKKSESAVNGIHVKLEHSSYRVLVQNELYFCLSSDKYLEQTYNVLMDCNFYDLIFKLFLPCLKLCILTSQ